MRLIVQCSYISIFNHQQRKILNRAHHLRCHEQTGDQNIKSYYTDSSFKKATIYFHIKIVLKDCSPKSSLISQCSHISIFNHQQRKILNRAHHLRCHQRIDDQNIKSTITTPHLKRHTVKLQFKYEKCGRSFFFGGGGQSDMFLKVLSHYDMSS